jgi:hypothetical protein
MTNRWTKLLRGLATVLLIGAAPAGAFAAACGDLNNDGQFNASDCLVLAQCLSGGGTCPGVSPGPLCGGGGLIACGDMFGDGNVSLAGLAADLSVCNDTVAGIPTLYDKCTGPGPNVAGCGGGSVTLHSQTITSSQTWPKSCKVTVDGTVFIGLPPGPNPPTTVIKIEKGSVIHALSAGADPAAVIWLPGTHIDAQGTPTEPIIFTSGKAPGMRAAGDWGGIEFNGRSTVNRPACQGTAEGIPLAFGGCVANDNSGIMSFVRAEYGGQIFTPNNELNGITFNATGSSTEFNFLASVMGDDDTLEWFGGTSNHKYLYSAASADDNTDTQLGYTGSVQYTLSIQTTLNGQLGRDGRGIELDNSEFDFEALPRNAPLYCNMTYIGSARQPNAAPVLGSNDHSDSGILVRRGGDIKIANSIVQDFEDSGFEIRDVSTARQACYDGTCTGGTRNGLPCSQGDPDPDGPNGTTGCNGGTCVGGNGLPDALTGKVMVLNSVFFDNGDPKCVGGTAAGTICSSSANATTCTTGGGTCTGLATEQAKNNDGTLDNNSSQVATACAAAGCPCTSESLYDMFVASNNVVPANGTSSVNTGITSQYPAIDNTGCTGLETPFVCCTGAGTGFCRALPDARPGGGLPSPFNCKTLTPLFDDNTTANYIGGINPAAPCVLTGASAHCDWLSKPWIESATQ